MFLLGRRPENRLDSVAEERFGFELTDMGNSRALWSFMVACGLLHGVPQMPTISSLEDQSQTSCKITNYTYADLAAGIMARGTNYLENFHSDSLLGLGKMAAVLGCAYPHFNQDQMPTTNMPVSGFRPDVRAPRFSKIILMNSVREFPKPFLPVDQSIAAWNRWLSDRRQSRSTPDYLDDGEWEGVYGYTDPWGETVSFDPPMQDIKFRSQAKTGSVGGCHSEASGVDSVGQFDLSLEVGNDGYIVGRKSYRNQHTSWNWHLSNTPFG